MYHAKDLGKAQYQIFNTPLRTEMLSKIKLENQIRTSLNEKRFTLHYQPIYSIIDDHLVGFEALVRWDHPQYGLLYPADFLAIAENSGLILWNWENGCFMRHAIR
jgi:predicted signal transduction protein with EAL and GGDEF domain